jgi:hypothetical protein
VSRDEIFLAMQDALRRGNPFKARELFDGACALSEKEPRSPVKALAEKVNEIDADRYRFLRIPNRPHCITVEQWGNVRSTLHGEKLDEAVDREMALYRHRTEDKNG